MVFSTKESVMRLFFDANKYASVFTKKALKKPECADMWLASWRDVDGYVRHDLLHDATTNNQAEYGSLLMALHHLFAVSDRQAQSWVSEGELPAITEVIICGDSQIVIYQMNGQYKCKDEGLKPLWLEAMNL